MFSDSEGQYKKCREKESSGAATWRVFACIISPHFNILKKESHLELFNHFDSIKDGLQIVLFLFSGECGRLV